MKAHLSHRLASRLRALEARQPREAEHPNTILPGVAPRRVGNTGAPTGFKWKHRLASVARLHWMWDAGAHDTGRGVMRVP